MEQVLLVIQVLLAIGLIGIVLLQRSESDGFGLGSGGGSNLLSGRASANLMTRTTAILAGLFILNSLALSVMAAHNRPASIVDAIKAQQEGEATPAVPVEGAVVKKDAVADKKNDATKPVVPSTTDAPVKAVKKMAKPKVPTTNDTSSEAPASNE